MYSLHTITVKGLHSMKQILIIPSRNELDTSLEIAEKYGLGFEYNDFFTPAVLDDTAKKNEIISCYKSHKLPEYTTSHGDFFDVTIFSSDSEIRRISEMRIIQSIETALEIGAKGVVFHTNHNPFLKQAYYIAGWLDSNVKFFSKQLEQHPELNIYIENMFDDTPDMLFMLAENLYMYDNFGVCLDYAHASISGTPINEWVEKLHPYVRHLHVNDNDLKSDLHLAIGDGKIDWIQFTDYYNRYFSNISMLIETNPIEYQLRSIKKLQELGIL